MVAQIAGAGGGCFRAGAQVQLQHGKTKAIETLSVGDEVLCFDERGEISLGKVTKVHYHEDPQPILRVRFWRGETHITANHWVVNQYDSFAEMGRLTTDDALVDGMGHLRPIISAEVVGYEPVWNLTVEPHHTFIVDGIRVHNGGHRDVFPVVAGAGGGSSSKGSGRAMVEDPDSLHSRTVIAVVDLLGEGKIGGLVDGAKSIYFNDTPLQNPDGSYNFKDVVWDTRQGMPDQEPMSGFSTVESPVESGQEVRKDNSYTFTINESDTDYVRVIMNIPSLISQDTTTGDIHGATVSYSFAISTDGGSFVDVIPVGLGSPTVTITGKTRSGYQRQHTLVLPKPGSSWVVRVTRITADSESSALSNKTYVASYVKVTNINLNYPNSAVVGIVTNAEEFSSVPRRSYLVNGLYIQVPSNYDSVARTYNGVWDGTFKIAVSNNPAWVMYDVLTDERYGLGRYIKPESIDIGKLYQIGKYCDGMVPNGRGGLEPRFSINTVIQGLAEAYRLVSDLASVFRGMAYWTGSVAGFTQDAPTDESMVFTQANVIDGLFTYSGTSRKDRHSVALITWNDPDDNYKQAVEYVEDPEMVARYGIRKLEMVAFGCTSRGQAIRVGRWALYTDRYESDAITFKVSLDAAMLLPGDVVRIHDQFRTGKRLSGRITSATLNAVVLDAPVELTGAGAVLSLRMPDGSYVDRTIEQGAGSHNQLTFWPSLGELPLPNSIFLVTEESLKPQLARIVNVAQEGSSPNVFSVMALAHNPNKYLAVDEEIYIDPPNTSILDSAIVPTPYNLHIEESTYLQGPQQLGVRVLVSWSGTAARYELRWRRTGTAISNWVTIETSSPSVDIDGALQGEYEFALVGVNGLGRKSQAITATYTVVGKDSPPDVPSAVELSPENTQIRIAWVVQAIDYYQTEIRYNTSSDFSSAVPAGSGAVIAQKEYLHTGLLPSVTYHYWLRAQDKWGNWSEWSTGHSTQTTNNAAPVASVLADAITESMLVPSLRQEINLITADGSVAGSVANQVGTAINAEAANRNIAISTAVAAEATNRAQAILAEATARASAIQSETTARTQALNTLSQSVATETQNRIQAIQSEAAARQQAVDAVGQTLTNYKTTTDAVIASHATTLSGHATTIGEHTQTLLNHGTSIAANANAISSLSVQLGDGLTLDPAPNGVFDFNNSLEGWGGYQLLLSLGTTFVRASASSYDPQLVSPLSHWDGAQYSLVSARIRRVAGSSWQGTVYYWNDNHGFDAMYQKTIPLPENFNEGDWHVLTWDMSNLTFGANDWVSGIVYHVRFDFGSTADDIFDVDWIVVGRYSPPASSAALIGLTGRVDQHDNDISSLSGVVQQVSGQINDGQSGLGALATALSTLSTDVSRHEGSLYSGSNSLTNLSSRIESVKTSLPQDTTNLVRKGDFEDGVVGEWGGSAGVVVSVAGQRFSKALQINARVLVHTPFPAFQGQTFFLSGWLDASTSNYNVGFGIRYLDVASNTLAWYVPPDAYIPAGQGWTFVEAVVTVDGGTALAALSPYLLIDGFDNFGTARAARLRITRHRDGADVTAESSAFQGLDQYVHTTVDGRINANSSDITALRAVVSRTDGQLMTARAVESLDIAINDAQNGLVRKVTDIRNEINDTSKGLNASAQAIDALETTVNDTEDGVVALATRTGLLETSLASQEFRESFESTSSPSRWHNWVGLGERAIVNAEGTIGGKALRVGNNTGDDLALLIYNSNLPFDPSKLYKMEVVARRVAGYGLAFFGVAGLASDGVAFRSVYGHHDVWNQYYVAASNSPLSGSFATYTGYFKGNSANPPGTPGTYTNPATLHSDVRYVRPLICVNLLNGQSAPGIVEIASVTISIVDEGEISARITDNNVVMVGSCSISGNATPAACVAAGGIWTPATAFADNVKGLRVTDVHGTSTVQDRLTAAKTDNNAISGRVTSLESALTPALNSPGAIATAIGNLVTDVGRHESAIYTGANSLTNLRSAIDNINSVTHQDPTNLVVKGSFEDGTAPHWSPGGWGGSIEVVSVTGQLFTKAIQCSGRDNIHLPFPVVAGELLYFSGWFDTSQANYEVGFGLMVTTATGAIVNWLFSDMGWIEHTGWVYKTGTLRVPSNAGIYYGLPYIHIAGFGVNMGVARAAMLRISRTPYSSIVDAEAQAFNELHTYVHGDSVTGAISSHSQDITTLKTVLRKTDGSLYGANALQSLDSTVTGAGGHASRLTTLESNLTRPSNGQQLTASAFESLDAEFQALDDEVRTGANSLSKLRASITDVATRDVTNLLTAGSFEGSPTYHSGWGATRTPTVVDVSGMYFSKAMQVTSRDTFAPDVFTVHPGEALWFDYWINANSALVRVAVGLRELDAAGNTLWWSLPVDDTGADLASYPGQNAGWQHKVGRLVVYRPTTFSGQPWIQLNGDDNSNLGSALLADLRVTRVRSGADVTAESTEFKWVDSQVRNTILGSEVTSIASRLSSLDNYVRDASTGMAAIASNASTALNTVQSTVYGNSALAARADAIEASLRNQPFVERFERPDALSRWRNDYPAGEVDVVAVSDSPAGGKVLQVGNGVGNDSVWLTSIDNIPFDHSKLYKMEVVARRLGGAGKAYFSVMGVQADGVTIASATPNYRQHDVAAVNADLTPGFVTYTGYFKGTASVGEGGRVGTWDNPVKINAVARYFRPALILNWYETSGVMQVASVTITIVDTDEINARIVSNNTVMVGACSVGSYASPAECVTAGGTWLPSSSFADSVKRVTVSDAYGTLSVGDRLTAAKSDNQQTAGRVTSVENILKRADGSLYGANALQAIDTAVNVDVLGGGASSVASRLNSLDAKVRDPGTGLDAVATNANYAKSAIDNSVTGLTALSTKLSSLDTKVRDPGTGLDAVAASADYAKAQINSGTIGLNALSQRIGNTESSLRDANGSLFGAGVLQSTVTNASNAYNAVTSGANSLTSLRASIDSVGARDTLNLIKGRFEDGQLGGWGPANILSVGGRHFTSALQVWNRDTHGPSFSARPGERLYVSFWGNTQGTPYNISLFVHANNQNGEHLWIGAVRWNGEDWTNPIMAIIPPGQNWTFVSGWVDMPAGDYQVANPYVLIDGWSNLGNCLIADMRISRTQDGSDITAESQAFSQLDVIVNGDPASGITGHAQRLDGLEIESRVTRVGYLERFDAVENINHWRNYNTGGPPIIVAATDGIGPNVMQFGQGAFSVIGAYRIPFDPTKTYRVEIAAREIGGSGTIIFAGVVPLNRDGLVIDYVGGLSQINENSGNAFVAFDFARSAWKTWTGYIKGTSTSSGGTSFSDIKTPGALPHGTVYIVPRIRAIVTNPTVALQVGLVRVTEIDEAEISSKITDYANVQIGVCSVGGYNTQTTCQAAGGTWYPSTALASAIKQVSVTGPDGTASLEQAFSATTGRLTTVEGSAANANARAGALEAKYTLKVQAGNKVAGFGLAIDGSATSEFAILADRFLIAGSTDVAPFYVDGSNVYINSGFIRNGTITNAHIANATVVAANIADATITTAKIADGQITSAKIGAAQIGEAHIADAQITTAKIAQLLTSDNYISGSQGWAITRSGNAEFNNAVFRGRAQNISNTNYVDFTATGASSFLKVGGAVDIKADGSGYFARSVISAPLVAAQGELSVATGSTSGVYYVNTGITDTDSWPAASHTSYVARAQIAHGNRVSAFAAWKVTAEVFQISGFDSVGGNAVSWGGVSWYRNQIGIKIVVEQINPQTGNDYYQLQWALMRV